MKRLAGMFAVALAIAVFAPGSAHAQSTASNQAFFAYNPDGITVTNMFTDVSLIKVPSALKTSTNGSVLIGLSMECVLWTNTSVTSTSGGGKNSASAQATVRAKIYVDGILATPEEVVYCDRTQTLGVTLTTGVLTDSVTVELFQATKNANHFNFFKGPLGATMHSVEVVVTGVVECRDNTGMVVTCSSGTLANMSTGTKVGIGKAVLTIQEYNNTNL
jgi:hypothetical protein